MSSSSNSSPPRNVVIVGAGVIGVCSAFFLLDAPNPPRVTLVEAYGVASSASGKAGGFLALDWHGPATTSLAALSWRLHAELAHTHGGAEAWGFRTMDSVSYTVQASRSPAPAPEGNPALEGSDMRPRPPPLNEDVDQRWLNEDGDTSVLGTKESTAQVTPHEFSQTLFEIAQRRGLQYIHGRPIHLSTSHDGRPESLNVTLRDSDGADVGETTIPCTDLIVTAGPWTGRVLDKLSLPPLPVTNLPGHSIIVRAAPDQPISATAVFASIYGANRQPRGRTTESPELFPRGDGTVYVAGENNAEPMPDDPAHVGSLVDDDIAERLVRATKHISNGLASGTVEKRQLCYRPTVTDGRPLVGKLKDGVWVATGHGPWGITLSTGTGKVISELVLDGKASSADIRQLSPSRFK